MMKEKTGTKTGTTAERYACRFLRKLRYRIKERNFTCKTGEIDIIAYDVKASELVFVEVRFREFGIDAAIESVTLQKRKRIFKAACYYLQLNPLYTEANTRFDIIALSRDEEKHWQLDHIQDAFRRW